MSQEPTNNASEFEEALRESLDAEEVRPGDVVEGTIAAIHGDVALVDVGGKSEAVLERAELDDLGTGEPVEVVVVSVGDEIRVSRRMALERRLKEKLESAFEEGRPVEGKVVGRRKGGFDVTVAGIRGFCPMSHIDDVRSDDLDRHLGQSYSFKVLEYEPDGRKLVVSRAALLREEKERAQKEAWERLTEGEELEGRVRSITDFGAFVDIGGVDGLVHVTELSHRHVRHPRDVVSPGDLVPVKVLELDREKNRISLSMKALEEDPWAGAEESYPVGGKFSGTVVRKVEFGAFVELKPGLDGLIHVSQLPPGMELDAPELEVGAAVEGWVRDVDPEAQRIGLSLRPIPSHDPWERIEMRYQEGQVVDAVVENGADFGVFVELEPGVSALIPASEMGKPREVDPRSAFGPGERLQGKVLSVDPERRRISVSIRALKHDRERQEYLAHMDKGAVASEPTMTGFGAQLAAALGQSEKKSKPKKKK